MKKILLLLMIAVSYSSIACKKNASAPEAPGNAPRTNAPTELQGNWMYGSFSMTEYWNQNPGDYLGNALEFAIAFSFDEDGDYVQYFTSRSYAAGTSTYHQSVTKGTAEFDPASKTFKTHPYSAHYKRTANGQVAEDRDLAKSELSAATTYSYTVGAEPNGSKAIYVTLQGTANPLTFLKK